MLTLWFIFIAVFTVNKYYIANAHIFLCPPPSSKTTCVQHEPLCPFYLQLKALYVVSSGNNTSLCSD